MLKEAIMEEAIKEALGDSKSLPLAVEKMPPPITIRSEFGVQTIPWSPEALQVYWEMVEQGGFVSGKTVEHTEPQSQLMWQHQPQVQPQYQPTPQPMNQPMWQYQHQPQHPSQYNPKSQPKPQPKTQPQPQTKRHHPSQPQPQLEFPLQPIPQPMSQHQPQSSTKKCRARYGAEKERWCVMCRKKKKCLGTQSPGAETREPAAPPRKKARFA